MTTTDWRTPDSPLDEVRYRLATFKNPSFDRTVVEALMAEIAAKDAKIKHLTEALELRGEQIFGREGD